MTSEKKRQLFSHDPASRPLLGKESMRIRKHALAILLSIAPLAWGASPVLAAPPPGPMHADVSYGPSLHQIMDVYLPASGGGPSPALIWFGGIWKPSKHVPDLRRFLPTNIAVIGVETRTINDGLEEKANPPISYVMLDACRAVQFVRVNAEKWNLDPQRIAVGGGSQGALPALYVGCAGERADPESNDPVVRSRRK
jgi:hypothetical protein